MTDDPQAPLDDEANDARLPEPDLPQGDEDVKNDQVPESDDE